MPIRNQGIVPVGQAAILAQIGQIAAQAPAQPLNNLNEMEALCLALARKHERHDPSMKGLTALTERAIAAERADKNAVAEGMADLQAQVNALMGNAGNKGIVRR